MDFIIYNIPSGKIESVRSAQVNGNPVVTGEGILSVMFGADRARCGAIPYDGRDLTGLRVDPAAGELVPDPGYTPPAPEPEEAG